MPDLFIDASFGLGGDMLLAGLLSLLENDTGSPATGTGSEAHCRELSTLFDPAGMGIRIRLEHLQRNAVSGVRLAIDAAPGQPLRHLHDLITILDRLAVSGAVRSRAARAFERLARVEAGVHGIGLEEVHFHEVGAVDTLVDVVGAFWALERLGMEQVVCSPLPWFTGSVDCAHGRLPLPAPATLALLEGKPVYPTDFTDEMITPTGALLLDAMVDRFDRGPEGVIAASILSYGARDTGGGLRLMLVEPVLGEDGERVMVLESTVDHLTGEELGAFFDAVMASGALDVLFTPGTMKKNRPGGQLQVICRPGDVNRVQESFFRHSLTLGIRKTLTSRVTLKREPVTRATPFGDVQAKRFHLGDGSFDRAEFEALKELACKTGKSVAELRYLLEGSRTEGEK